LPTNGGRLLLALRSHEMNGCVHVRREVRIRHVENRRMETIEGIQRCLALINLILEPHEPDEA